MTYGLATSAELEAFFVCSGMVGVIFETEKRMDYLHFALNGASAGGVATYDA